ncbi:MAG: hypothetical protein C0597_15695, partial [Marinilabiliales bacterium]
MKKLLTLITLTALLFSCSQDESSDAEIVDFIVTETSSTDLIVKDIIIDSELNKIYVFFDNDLSQMNASITLTADIKLSSGAKASSVVSSELSFANADEVKTIEVTAENGSTKNWYIYLIHHQLQNSGFGQWFDNQGMNGKDYKEIGSSAGKSVWSTANMATSIYDVHCTKPLADGTNTLVEITTGKTSQVPVTAGTIFLGTFDLAGAIAHPTEPEQATIFGVPFIFRPTGVKFKYKYQAGDTLIQATLNNPTNIFGGFTVEDIDGEDKCSMYAILESRNGDQVSEIAYTKIESGTTDDVMIETTMTFDYSSTA